MEKYMKFTMYKKETTDKMYHENPYRAVNFAKDADLLRNRKVNTKKRQNRHLPELAFLTKLFMQTFLIIINNVYKWNNDFSIIKNRGRYSFYFSASNTN